MWRWRTSRQWHQSSLLRAPDGSLEYFGKQRAAAAGRPDFQLGIAARLDQDVHLAVANAAAQIGDDRAVAAIQPIGDPQQGSADANDVAILLAQLAVAVLGVAGVRLAVITG